MLTSWIHFRQHDQSVSEQNKPLLHQSFSTNEYNGLPFAPDDLRIHNSESKHDIGILNEKGYDVDQTRVINNETSSVESPVEKVRSAYSVDSDRQLKASSLLIFSCNFCVENANSSFMYVNSG